MASKKIQGGGGELFLSGSKLKDNTELVATGATATISNILVGAYQSMILRSDGEVQSLVEFDLYVDGGGLETVSNVFTGAGGGYILDDTAGLITVAQNAHTGAPIF